MLGIGNSLTKSGGGIRSVVKKGLQAWYKADKTQAPLGEEEIANGNFSIGSELLSKPNFLVDGQLSKVAGDTKWYLVPNGGVTDPNHSAVISNNELTISVGPTNRDGGTGRVFGQGDSGNILKQGETYVLTYTVVSAVNASGNFKIYTGNPGYQSVEDIGGSTAIGTHTVYFTYDDNSSLTGDRSTLPILLNDGNLGSDFTASITLSDVSLKRTNPNDSWTLGGGTGWSVEDGTAVSDSSGSDYIYQNIGLTQGKSYEISYDIVSYTSGQVRVEVSTNEHGQYRNSVGTYVERLKPSSSTSNRPIFRDASGGGFVGSISNVSVKEITNSVRDYSKNSNNAILYSGKALELDGTNDKIDLDYWKSKTIDANTKATFACWINANDVSQERIFLGHNQPPNSRFYVGSRLEQLVLGWGTSSWTSLGVNILDNTWYRVVVVVDGKTCKIYMDGEYQYEKTNTNDFTTDEEGLYLGAHGDGSSYDWVGKLADFQIYDKAWNESDVKYDWENPDKDVFDDQDRQRAITESLIPAIEDSGMTDSLGDLSNWGAQALNADWGEVGNEYQDDPQLYSKSGNSITFGSINESTRLYPPRLNDVDEHNNYLLNSIVDGNDYVVKYTISSKVGDPNLSFYTGDDGGYVDIPREVGVNEFQYTHRGIPRSTNPMKITTNGTSVTLTNFSIHRVTTRKAEIKETDCKVLLKLNEGAGDRVYNAAPILGAEMWDGANGDITNWTPFDNNEVSSDDGAVKIKHIDNSSGVYIYLRDAKDLNANLVIGETYELSFNTKVNQGSVQWRIYDTDGTNYFFDNLTSTDYITQTIIFKATDNDNHYLFPAITSGEEVWIKDISLKKIKLSDSYIHIGNPTWATGQPYIPQLAMSSYSKKAIFSGEGSGDYIDCGKEDSIDDIFDGGGTWSVWVNGSTDGGGSFGTILSKVHSRLRVIDDSGDDMQLNFLHRFDGTVNGTPNAYGSWKCPTTALLKNKLNHIAISYNNDSHDNQPSIYINGVSQTLDNNLDPAGTRFTDANNSFLIGDVNSTTDHCWDGFIDEVAVFNKALSQTEVQEIFNAGMALDVRDHSAYSGSEEITNGDFTAAGTLGDATWSLGWGRNGAGSDVSIADGKLIVSNTSGSANDGRIYATNGLSNFNVVASGKKYKLTYTISEVSGGTPDLQYHSGGSYVDFTASQVTVGTHTITYTSDGTLFLLRQQAQGVTVKFSNISLKEVDLKGYWRNNGLDTWTDLSPYGNNGTVNGSPTTIQLQEVPYFKRDSLGLYMNKVREKGFNFDGASYVKITNSDDFNVSTTNAISVEAWVKRKKEYANTQYIFSNSNWSDDDGFSLISSDSDFNFTAETGSDKQVTSAHSDSGDWFHVVATYDETTYKIYVNGDKGTDVASTEEMVDLSADLIIGAAVGLSNFWNGVIDDVKFYNRVLTLSEIERNHKATKRGHTNNTSIWSDDFNNNLV